MKDGIMGVEFYEIINKNVLNEIAKAYSSINSDTFFASEEIAKEVIEEVTIECKKTVNRYIDGQCELIKKLKEA